MTQSKSKINETCECEDCVANKPNARAIHGWIANVIANSEDEHGEDDGSMDYALRVNGFNI